MELKDQDFFKSLKVKEAKIFLKNYLEEASNGFFSLIPDLTIDNIIVDYSFESLPSVVNWITKRMITVPKSPDESLPKWITESDTYKKSLYEFDNNSNILLLRLSYYWGECFVRNTNLKWDIGRYAENENYPVLRRFICNMEMAPFKICNNIIRSKIEYGSKERTETCIESWLSHML